MGEKHTFYCILQSIVYNKGVSVKTVIYQKRATGPPYFCFVSFFCFFSRWKILANAVLCTFIALFGQNS